MKNINSKKKTIIISISGVIIALTLLMAILIMVLSSSKVEFGPGAQKTIERYTDLVVQGNSEEAYEMLGDVTKGWLNRDDFKEYIDIQRDQIEINYLIDANKEPKKIMEDEDGTQVEYYQIPILRTYYKEVDGKNVAKKEEKLLLLDKKGERYYIIIDYKVFRDETVDGALGKAKEYIVSSLGVENDKKKIEENIPKIDHYLMVARKWAENNDKEESILRDCELLEGYKWMVSGNIDEAVEYVNVLKEKSKEVDDREYRIKVQILAAEIYLNQNNYEGAIEALNSATQIDPDNEAIKKEGKRVKSIMAQKIKIHINNAVAQLKSAASVENANERVRIARDIVLDEGEKAVKINSKIPDGYFIKANAYFLAGEGGDAKEEILKALKLSKSNDVVFNAMVSQLKGMISMTPSIEKFNSEAYAEFANEIKPSIELTEIDTTGVLDMMN